MVHCARDGALRCALPALCTPMLCLIAGANARCVGRARPALPPVISEVKQKLSVRTFVCEQCGASSWSVAAAPVLMLCTVQCYAPLLCFIAGANACYVAAALVLAARTAQQLPSRSTTARTCTAGHCLWALTRSSCKQHNKRHSHRICTAGLICGP